MVQLSKSDALRRIRRALDKIPTLKQMKSGSPEFEMWRRDTRIALQYTFGDDSSQVREFADIRYTPMFGPVLITAATSYEADYQSELEPAYQFGLDKATVLLESLLEEIEEYWPDDEIDSPPHEPENTPEQTVSTRIFVVHGRDDGTRNTVVLFLERQDLEPIVLMEQPNEGRTIIEKFEDYSDVAYAVILCTPDDVGKLNTDDDELRPRPRQNVVLEWGFFMGKLGRRNVCALFTDDVEIPSDYSGVIYIPMDAAGAWQMELLRELKSAGVPVDANQLL